MFTWLLVAYALGGCDDGTEQSPIPFTDDATPNCNIADSESMTFNDVSASSTHVSGDTISWSGNFGTFTKDDVTYRLNEINLRTPSEHTINEEAADIEVQLLYTEPETGDGLLIGVLGNAPEGAPSSDYAFYNALQASLPSANAPDVTINVGDLFSEVNTFEYYEYDGSMTHGDCAEGMKWIVLANPGEVSNDLLVSLASGAWATTMADSARATQDLGSRTVTAGPGGIDDWNYEGNGAEWGGLCACGSEQSPTDLPNADTLEDRSSYLLQAMAFAEVVAQAEDTGTSFEWANGDEGMGTFIILDDVMYENTKYRLHTGSEHTTEGYRHDLEIQFYFESLSGPTQNTVISVLCDTDGDVEATQWFNDMEASLPGTSDTVYVNPKDLLQLFDSSKYYRYDGSFTNPPCTENVNWVIMAETCLVPEDLLTTLQNFGTLANGNYRETQELGSRTVRVGNEWGYPFTSNAVWGGTCQSGTEQSPVDLPSHGAAEPRREDLNKGKIQYNTMIADGVDTGYGITYPASGTLELGNVEYNLLEMQLHTGAEHTVAGNRAALEIHLVHQEQGTTNTNRMDVVLAVHCELNDAEPNGIFTALSEGLPNKADTNPTYDLSQLFDSLDTAKYYRYEGSLTQAPCTEGIDWLVLADYCSVPSSFLDELATFNSMSNNYRATQPLNGRTVYTDTREGDNESAYSYTKDWEWVLIGAFLGVGAILFCAACFRTLHSSSKTGYILEDGMLNKVKLQDML